MDPFDLLRLKNQLGINPSEAWSAGLAGLVRTCKELRHRVPAVLGLKRTRAAAQGWWRRRCGCWRGEPPATGGEGAPAAGVQAVKRFFFGYKEVVAVAMGSLEAKGGRAAAAAVPAGDCRRCCRRYWGSRRTCELGCGQDISGSSGSYQYVSVFH